MGARRDIENEIAVIQQKISLRQWQNSSVANSDGGLQRAFYFVFLGVIPNAIISMCLVYLSSLAAIAALTYLVAKDLYRGYCGKPYFHKDDVRSFLFF